jgi:ABC-type glycerol-3-phosphate transport system substrate-binding protein
MKRRLALLLAALTHASAAHASADVRLWHALDPAMSAQLERHVADYNARQAEFRVRLEPLAAAERRSLVRLALPLNTARPVLYYNRDAFRRAS